MVAHQGGRPQVTLKEFIVGYPRDFALRNFDLVADGRAGVLREFPCDARVANLDGALWPAILIMGSLRFGVLKSEGRNPKSERNPKSQARTPPTLVGGRRNGVGAPGGVVGAEHWLGPDGLGTARMGRASAFGLRFSFGFRSSDFGFAYRRPAG